MTAMARSSTLPRMTKALNSLSMIFSFEIMRTNGGRILGEERGLVNNLSGDRNKTGRENLRIEW